MVHRDTIPRVNMLSHHGYNYYRPHVENSHHQTLEIRIIYQLIVFYHLRITSFFTIKARKTQPGFFISTIIKYVTCTVVKVVIPFTNIFNLTVFDFKNLQRFHEECHRYFYFGSFWFCSN